MQFIPSGRRGQTHLVEEGLVVVEHRRGTVERQRVEALAPVAVNHEAVVEVFLRVKTHIGEHVAQLGKGAIVAEQRGAAALHLHDVRLGAVQQGRLKLGSDVVALIFGNHFPLVLSGVKVCADVLDDVVVRAGKGRPEHDLLRFCGCRGQQTKAEHHQQREKQRNEFLHGCFLLFSI